MNWDLITNIILIASLITMALFVGLAFYQWIKRKSFSKIDPELRWAIIPLILMVAVYYIFDHFIILATRPNGTGEPSFPSSHVMFVATLFALTAIILPKYVKSKTALVLLDSLMLILTVLVAVGRVFANMHWVSDVIGALVFAAIFTAIYYLIIRRIKHA